MADEQQESRLTVVLAFAANLGIALAKTAAALLTGSAALASEAGHSFADTANEGLLLTALRRSRRPPDRRHPFGHGSERYVWSLLVAVCIFGMGALFAFLQGFQALLGQGETDRDFFVGYLVLAVSAVLESISWRQAFRQARAGARAAGRPFLEFVRTTDDPTTKSVLFEDTAALIGLALAAGGLALHEVTGSDVWDGTASILIGVVLTVAAFLLGRTNLDLLIGRQAHPSLLRGVREVLRAAPEVVSLVDLLTMTVGTDQVLVCARLDFRDDLKAADLERACVRLGDELRERFPDIDETFIEPVPGDDVKLRERVLARYGRPPGEWAAEDGR